MKTPSAKEFSLLGGKADCLGCVQNTIKGDNDHSLTHETYTFQMIVIKQNMRWAFWSFQMSCPHAIMSHFVLFSRKSKRSLRNGCFAILGWGDSDSIEKSFRVLPFLLCPAKRVASVLGVLLRLCI